jgi:hypothetical protein
VAPADTILVPMSRPVRHCPAPPQHDPAAPARSDAAAAASDTAATDSDVGNDPVVTMPAAAHDVAASGISASPSPSPSPAPAPQLVPRRQQQPLPPYPMVTRSRTGTLRANQRYACTATTTAPPVPSSVREALWDPDWRAAMQVEFDALQANRTWSLLPCHLRQMGVQEQVSPGRLPPATQSKVCGSRLSTSTILSPPSSSRRPFTPFFISPRRATGMYTS